MSESRIFGESSPSMVWLPDTTQPQRPVTRQVPADPTPESDAFLAEVVALGKRRGFSLAHEDSQGSFLVLPYDAELDEWLLGALPRATKTTFEHPTRLCWVAPANCEGEFTVYHGKEPVGAVVRTDLGPMPNPTT